MLINSLKGWWLPFIHAVACMNGNDFVLQLYTVAIGHTLHLIETDKTKYYRYNINHINFSISLKFNNSSC